MTDRARAAKWLREYPTSSAAWNGATDSLAAEFAEVREEEVGDGLVYVHLELRALLLQMAGAVWAQAAPSVEMDSAACIAIADRLMEEDA